MIGSALLILASVFLAVHLLTDARRMVQVLRMRHFPDALKGACSHCDEFTAGVKEAWWEVATLGALVGHFILSGEITGLIKWAV